MTKKRGPQFFIVFAPTGETPPVVVHDTHQGALYAAYGMAKQHPGVSFFVMGSMSRPCVVEPTKVDEGDCPGHVASDSDPKVCRHCGTHSESLRDERAEID